MRLRVLLAVVALASSGAAHEVPSHTRGRLRTRVLGVRPHAAMPELSRVRALRGGEKSDESEEEGIPRHMRTMVVTVVGVLALLIALGVVQAAQLLALAINSALTCLRPGTRHTISQQHVLLSFALLYMVSGAIRSWMRAAARAGASSSAGAPATSAPGQPGQPQGGSPGRPSIFSFVDGLKESLGEVDLDRPLRARLRNQIRWYEPNSTRVTFADVAGCDEAVAEVKGVVDFLRDPQKYARLGARMPRGILLEGPPGTGCALRLRCAAALARTLRTR